MAPSDKKAKKDKWSAEQTLALCDFLNKYINEHGRNARFIWVELQPKFATLYNRTFASEKALKNKFDGMKRDYNLWKSLKNGETGLGWNASVQKLDCADEWWKMKIKQPSLELQYTWDQLFGDAVAGGEDCISSAMNTKAFQEVPNENAEDEDVESDDDLDDTQEVAEYYFKHMYKEPCMTFQQKGEDWMKDVLNGNSIRYVNAFRMHPHIFKKLCRELHANYGLKSSDKMSALEKLGIFVYTLALGMSNRDVGERFQHSGETIGRAFHDVLDAITAKDCIGCIDGTHIRACIPEAQQVRYIGKNGIPTFNVNIISLIKDIRKEMDILFRIPRQDIINRWKLLDGMPQFSVKTQIAVIMAAFALHNYIRNSDEEDMMFTMIKQHPNYIPPDELHNVRGHETNSENVSQGTSNEMKRIRDDIAASIWNARHSGANERPPMLEKGNYIPWEIRFRRFLDNKFEEGDRLWRSIEKGPYKRPMIANPDNTTEHILEPLSKMIKGHKKQYIANVKDMNYLHQAIPNDIYNLVDACKNAKDLYDSLIQFEPRVLASKARKVVKNHDPLALLAHSNASSSQSHANSCYSPQPYYVTHPSSVADYKDEYQRELQGDSQEDKLTISMMLLARAITQKFSTPTNNHLRTSSNIKNQAVIHDGRVDIQTKNSGYGGNVNRNLGRKYKNQAFNAGNGNDDNEAESNLKDVENDSMLDNSYGDETLEELSVAVIMMAQIQLADDNADSKPSYDAKAVSEVNASNKVHEHVNHAKHKTIIHASDDDQIDSNIIFDDTYVENNGGTSEHDSNAHDEYHNIQMLAYNVKKEVENKKRLNNELKKAK
nr:hypothetical protein [Tanacetum cinerariifolium]